MSASWSHVQVGCLLEKGASGRKKRLARDVFNAFATYSGHVHDVTDADCGVQNGSTDGRVFATFKCRVLTGPEIEWKKRNAVSDCFIFFFILFHSYR